MDSDTLYFVLTLTFKDVVIIGLFALVLLSGGFIWGTVTSRRRYVYRD